MATCTHAVATASTSNAQSYASGSFTPTANDLLVVLVVASGTVAAGSVSGSTGLSFTKVAEAVKASGADTLYCFVADALASAASQTVTFSCTGDAATGAVVSVVRVSGMTRTGSSAVRQTAKQDNQAASTTPAPAFSAAALTGNPTIGMVGNAANPATLTNPSGWTEQSDTGYNNPATGSEYVTRDSGFTGTTITWGSTSGSAFGAIIAELDTSLAPITGSMAATEGGADALAATGSVKVQGSLAAVEAGADTLAAAGAVKVQGTLAAAESGADTLAATGSVGGGGASGTFAAVEAGADTLAAVGAVKVQGMLAAAESGVDALSTSAPQAEDTKPMTGVGPRTRRRVRWEYVNTPAKDEERQVSHEADDAEAMLLARAL